MKTLTIIILAFCGITACSRREIEAPDTYLAFGEASRTAEGFQYLKTHPHIRWVSGRITRSEVFLNIELVNSSSEKWVLPVKDPVQILIKVGNTGGWNKAPFVLINPVKLMAIEPNAKQEISVRMARNWREPDTSALQVIVGNVSSDVEVIP